MAWRGERNAREVALATEKVSSERAISAEERKEIARIHAYSADMNLVQTALGRNNLGRARDLLNRHRLADGEKDLRGWEWRYLWEQCKSDEIATLFKSKKSIDAIALSADSKWMATADYNDGFVHV